MIPNPRRMRIFLGAGVLLGAALIAAVLSGAFARSTSATAPDVITIASAANGNNVPVGNNFTVTLAVTASTNPYKSIQWEIAYPANVSFVSPATYTCSQFPSETETQPAEDNSGTLLSGLPGMTILGGGANCASLSGSFNGSTTLGVFVTITLHCGANGNATVIVVTADPGDPTGDQFFGTTLGDKNAANITTDLQPKQSTAFGQEAAISTFCGVAPTNTPTPSPSSTTSPTPSNTPTPSETPTITNTPTVTNTPTATSTATPTPIGTPAVPSKDLDGDGLLDSVEVGLGTCPGLQPKFQSMPSCHVGGSLVNPLIPDAKDTDGDGLSDGLEHFTYHTNPLQADSDGDGLPDGVEVNTAHTDPLSQDTDGDGLSDGFEMVVSNTIPTNPNTDGDGCSDSREIGLNHVQGGDRDPTNPWDFFDVPVPALSTGNPNGTRDRAVSIADVIAVVQYIGTQSGQGPNVNGVSYDTDHDGDAVPDGREYDRSPSTTPGKPWRSTAPNGAVSVADALVALNQVGDSCAADPPTVAGADLDGDGLPDSVEIGLGTCPGLQPKYQSMPVCHVGGVLANPLIPDAADTDGDGIPDGLEQYTSHTNPLQPDTDGDGLPDGVELTTTHSDPLVQDTDGDGLGDGFEYVTPQTSPVKPNTDGDGCFDSEELLPNHQQGGDRDPLNPWDFFDVPLPPLSAGNPNGTKNGAITIGDALGVVAYIGTFNGGGPNGNGLSYNSDVNGDGVFDGREYDRGASTTPGKPWRSSAANGVVNIQDALIMLAQIGDQCVDP